MYLFYQLVHIILPFMLTMSAKIGYHHRVYALCVLKWPLFTSWFFFFFQTIFLMTALRAWPLHSSLTPDMLAVTWIFSLSESYEIWMDFSQLAFSYPVYTYQLLVENHNGPGSMVTYVQSVSPTHSPSWISLVKCNLLKACTRLWVIMFPTNISNKVLWQILQMTHHKM